MFVRFSTFKFSNQTKPDAFSELYKNILIEKYIKKISKKDKRQKAKHLKEIKYNEKII